MGNIDDWLLIDFYRLKINPHLRILSDCLFLLQTVFFQPKCRLRCHVAPSNSKLLPRRPTAPLRLCCRLVYFFRQTKCEIETFPIQVLGSRDRCRQPCRNSNTYLHFWTLERRLKGALPSSPSQPDRVMNVPGWSAWTWICCTSSCTASSPATVLKIRWCYTSWS